MNKTTSRDLYTRIASVMANDAEVVAFCNKKIDAMDTRNEKRKNAEKKPTKAQVEALALRPSIVAVLGETGVTVKTIADAIGIEAYQKVTPILRALVEEGVVVSTKEKGKVLYALAPAEE